MSKPLQVRLTAEPRKVLESLGRGGINQVRVSKRAQIRLMADVRGDGRSPGHARAHGLGHGTTLGAAGLAGSTGREASAWARVKEDGGSGSATGGAGVLQSTG